MIQGSLFDEPVVQVSDQKPVDIFAGELTKDRPKFFDVPATTTDAAERAALIARRDRAHEVLVICRKSPDFSPEVDAGYLAELGMLQRRIWDLDHGVRA